MYEHLGHGALDYAPCRYGNSRILFRGPKARLEKPYCAMLGGSEVYGKFVKTPFPQLLESRLQTGVVNLGCVNAGLDVFVGDPAIADICAGAELCVVQVLGAQNASNRFYRVHPRRNDRFVAPTDHLTQLFPDVDFTEFHFTGHLVRALSRKSPERFRTVVLELKRNWVDQMKVLARAIGGRSILVVFKSSDKRSSTLIEPMFVDKGMLREVALGFTDLVTLKPGPGAVAPGVEGKVFAAIEELAARHSPGPRLHRHVDRVLGPRLSAHLS